MKQLTLLLFLTVASASAQIGTFENASNVGETPKRGSVTYDAAKGEYRVSGGGENMWAQKDAFFFLWRHITGDVTITADVRFEGTGAVAHRKAALIVRQDLTDDSAYADAALHGDGLTSLQYRPTAAAGTKEVRSELKGPVRLRLERKGDEFTLYAGEPGGELTPTKSVTVAMKGGIYAGLAVCSHDANVLETAIFSNVTVKADPLKIRTKVAIFDIAQRTTEVIYTTDGHFEAPNWSRDGKFLLLNSGGSIYRLSLAKGSEPEKLDLGSITGCNNDHGISRDGKRLALSCRVPGAPGSQVYVADANGKNAKLLTPKAPSYYHGWSPDGKWLAFTGQRNGEFDVYRVSVNGGEEQQLTTAKGLDDGPDYSPDGKWIYVNSDRTGNFHIWRFPAKGAGPGDKLAQQITKDELEDWFPHPSPNGKWMVLISFPPGTKGHPANQLVQLRLARPSGAMLTPIVKLFGGQGSMNVNSWSPDSKRFAFISYELLP
jgi:TolB protein